MLRKNVYIVYPAGYHGNYLKWAIESSDIDMRKDGVPSNPTNNSTSKELGGKGTSHLSKRIPTHAIWPIVRSWILFNKPDIKKVYVINAGNDLLSSEEAAVDLADIMIQDPDGVVISITANNDPDIVSYGNINAVTKWPTNVHLSNLLGYNKNIDNSYDPFNCADSISFRNKVVEGDIQFGAKHPVNISDIDRRIEQYNIWHNGRLELQPDEMIPGNYPTNVTSSNRYFSLSCKDVVSSEFPSMIRNLLDTTGISDNYDTELVDNAHQSYVGAQPNLQWFTSVEYWKKTRIVDVYLMSHSVIQAEIIKRIFEASPELKFQLNWKDMTVEQISAEYKRRTSSFAKIKLVADSVHANTYVPKS